MNKLNDEQTILLNDEQKILLNDELTILLNDEQTILLNEELTIFIKQTIEIDKKIYDNSENEQIQIFTKQRKKRTTYVIP